MSDKLRAMSRRIDALMCGQLLDAIERELEAGKLTATHLQAIKLLLDYRQDRVELYVKLRPYIESAKLGTIEYEIVELLNIAAAKELAEEAGVIVDGEVNE